MWAGAETADFNALKKRANKAAQDMPVYVKDVLRRVIRSS